MSLNMLLNDLMSLHRMSETVHTLFFSILGFISLDKLKIDNPEMNNDCKYKNK